MQTRAVFQEYWGRRFSFAIRRDVARRLITSIALLRRGAGGPHRPHAHPAAEEFDWFRDQYRHGGLAGRLTLLSGEPSAWGRASSPRRPSRPSAGHSAPTGGGRCRPGGGGSRLSRRA